MPKYSKKLHNLPDDNLLQVFSFLKNTSYFNNVGICSKTLKSNLNVFKNDFYRSLLIPSAVIPDDKTAIDVFKNKPYLRIDKILYKGMDAVKLEIRQVIESMRALDSNALGTNNFLSFKQDPVFQEILIQGEHYPILSSVDDDRLISVAGCFLKSYSDDLRKVLLHKDNNFGLLTYATEAGQLKMTKFILNAMTKANNGLPPDLTYGDPLFCAFEKDHTEVLDFLLSKCQSESYKHVISFENYSVFEWAAIHGALKVIQTLLPVLSEKERQQALAANKYRAIYSALRFNRLECCEFLLRSCSDALLSRAVAYGYSSNVLNDDKKITLQQIHKKIVADHKEQIVSVKRM